METGPVIAIRMTECLPELEEKFNQWYDEVHIPLFLKSQWLDRVTRYRLVPIHKEAPKYLTIYEFKDQKAYQAYLASPEFDAAIKEIKETWPDGGYEMKVSGVYQPIKTWPK